MIVIPSLQSQSWYPILLKMTIKNKILLLNHLKFLFSPEGKIHPLIQNSSLNYQANFIFKKDIRKGYRPYFKCPRTGWEPNFYMQKC